MSYFRKEASSDEQQAPGTSLVTQVLITKWGPGDFIKRGSQGHNQAWIHNGFHRFTEIGQIFHNKYIFNHKKLSQLKSCSIYPTYNMEINLYELIRRFAWLHPRRTELANILSEWLRNPGKGALGSGAYPEPPKKLAPSALV